MSRDRVNWSCWLYPRTALAWQLFGEWTGSWKIFLLLCISYFCSSNFYINSLKKFFLKKQLKEIFSWNQFSFFSFLRLIFCKRHSERWKSKFTICWFSPQVDLIGGAGFVSRQKLSQSPIWLWLKFLAYHLLPFLALC